MIPSIPQPRAFRVTYAAYVALFFVYLMAPLAVAAAFAFNDSMFPSLPWNGFTLDWFVGEAPPPPGGLPNRKSTPPKNPAPKRNSRSNNRAARSYGNEWYDISVMPTYLGMQRFGFLISFFLFLSRLALILSLPLAVRHTVDRLERLIFG